MEERVSRGWWGVEPIARRRPGTPVVSVLFYELCRLVVTTLMVTVWRGRWHGVRQVPTRGAVLVVCNHQSFLDPPLVGCCAGPRQADFVARAGLFRLPPLGWLLRRFWCIPVKEGGASDSAAVREMLARLADDRVLVIFPEGTRTPDGAIHEFKRGAALVLARARCTVQPAAVEGIFEAWPRHRKLPSVMGASVATAFGTPIDHAELMRHGAGEALARMQREVEDLHLALRRVRSGI